MLTSVFLKKADPMCQITKGTSDGISKQAPWTPKGEWRLNCIAKSQQLLERQRYTKNEMNLLQLSNTREKLTL